MNLYLKKAIRLKFLLLGTVSTIAVTNTIIASPVAASGCSIPPCGALSNHSITSIKVRWKNNDNDKKWKYDNVAPGMTKGGYGNDRLDIDYFYIPKKCSATGKVERSGLPDIDSRTWYSGWNKMSSVDTVIINYVHCNLGGI